MAKRFRLRVSLPSFHLCCSERTLFPRTSSFSPVNHKAFEIPYPNFPDPPPSSPVHPISNHHVARKFTPTNYQSSSEPLLHNAISQSQYTAKKKSIPLSRLESKDEKIRRNSSKITRSCLSNSSISSDWLSSEETESLLQCSSLDSSYDFGYPLETSIHGNRKKNKNLTLQKLKRIFNTCKGGEKTKKITWVVERKSPVKKSPWRRGLLGKVNESYAVVQSSDNPYEDFKLSMLEMILAKQMFEDKDLEQLLQCFLSLNSHHHHLVIVQAFSDIWKELFDV